ncbi:MAG: caspase family protein, partial [Mucilaginibacter sp.]
GQYIVVTKRDSIYVFLFETGQLLKAFKVLPGNHRFKGDAADLNFVNDAQISPDLQYLVAGCFSGSFEVWNFQTNEFIGDFTGHRDYINTVNFSSDGKYLITSSADHTAKVWETKSFKQITNLDEHENEVTSAKFTSSGDYIVTKSMDFTFKIWKIHENKSLFTYFPINDKDFLITDSVGRYDGSAAGRKLIYYACGTELITLDQLREITWEDGLVAKLTGADKQAIVAKKLNDIELCGVTPLVEKVVSTGRNYRYKIVPQKGGLGQVLLWVNGVNIRTYRPNELIHHLNYYELLIKPKDIANRLYSDQNNTIDVRAYASNVKLISKGDPTTVDQKDVRNVRHHFYCISAGITLYKGDDLNTLHFASKDAEDMSQTVSLAAKKLLDTDNKESAVSTYLLNTPPPGFNDDKRLLPYRENLRRVFFEVASKATADDIVFIFLSGHGVLQSDQFYYLTADASSFNLDGVENTAAISTDTLKKWLISIPATKKILILDACNSGQTVESLNIKKNIPDDQKRSLAKLNESTATIILAASASGHSAYEMSAYGQGILAYNLLLG